jgi:hypothetical protein
VGVAIVGSKLAVGYLSIKVEQATFQCFKSGSKGKDPIADMGFNLDFSLAKKHLDRHEYGFTLLNTMELWHLDWESCNLEDISVRCKPWRFTLTIKGKQI